MRNIMRNCKAGLIALVLTITLFSLCTSVFAADDKLFYRGDFDDQIVTAANGAKVNAGYHKFLSEGAFGGSQLIEVIPGVWQVVGYSLSNYTFIEGKAGLIAFDSGSNIGMGKTVLEMVQQRVNQPVSAVIYSHFHYTGGTKAYAASNPDKKIEIYGNPKLEKNMKAGAGMFRNVLNRRGGMQLGAYLPHDGPDAAYGPAEPTFADPELNKHGHMPLTYRVKDGEKINIDGIEMTFYHVVGDTDGSLIVDVPSMDLVLHNTAVTNLLFSLYTLRGTPYRSPAQMIAGIDKLLSLNRKYVLGVHGLPLSGERAQSVPKAHRDAYAFVYNQSLRAINAGKTQEQMVDEIRLPDHLVDLADMYPAYVDNEYNVRGQYRGIIGWYGEEIADLHPVKAKELGETVLKLAGSEAAVIAAAKAAIAARKYNLAVQLYTYVIDANPESASAKQGKADVLRHMAYTTRAGVQTRNYLLTNALHLEGKLDMNAMPKFLFMGPATAAKIMASLAGSSIKELEIKLDPAKVTQTVKTVTVTFTDLNRSWDIQIRKGVAQVVETTADSKVAATLQLPREVWAQIAVGELALKKAVSSEKAKLLGSKEAAYEVLGAFDNIEI